MAAIRRRRLISALSKAATIRSTARSIDEVRVYTDSLSASEIQTIYNASAPVASSGTLEDGLVAHYKFDENTGSTAYDSADTNNGTLTNMASNDWVAGVHGRALDFDGSNDYIAIASDTANDITGSIL